MSQPDVVQGWMYHANVAASVSRSLGYFKCPLVWGIRQSTTRLADDTPLTRILIATGAGFSLSAARIVYVSLSAALTHERWGYPKSKRVLIPNGIDTSRFRPNPGTRADLLARLGQPQDSLLIGRVARFAPMKDFPTLFATFARIRTAIPQSRLVLAGRGMTTDNSQLMDVLSTHGSPDQVHFLGPVLKIEELYQGLDLLLSTSRSNEGFPNVVFEAVASGCPVVSTAVGNTVEERELQAAVIEPGDARAMADAALRVLTLSAAERQSLMQNSRTLLEARFGLDAFADAYLDVWQSVFTGDRRVLGAVGTP